MQSKGCGEVVLLGRKRGGVRVGHDVVCGAIHKAGALLDDLMGLVALHIDVLGARVVLTVACGRDGCWGVGKECGGGFGGAEEH